MLEVTLDTVVLVALEVLEGVVLLLAAEVLLNEEVLEAG